MQCLLTLTGGVNNCDNYKLTTHHVTTTSSISSSSSPEAGYDVGQSGGRPHGTIYHHNIIISKLKCGATLFCGIFFLLSVWSFNKQQLKVATISVPGTVTKGLNTPTFDL